MSTLKTDNIVNVAGNGPPTLTNGVNVTGSVAATTVTATGVVTGSSFAGSGANLTGISSEPFKPVSLAGATYVVTVASVDSVNKFHIAGVSNPTLNFSKANVYIFDLSDSSNAGHPLVFKTSGSVAYTTGVVVTGTAGQAGAKVTITVAASAPAALLYSCSAHGNAMGNTIAVAASGAMDVGTFNFFDQGSLTANTTVSFASVPTNARWTYTFAGVRQKTFALASASADSVTFSTSSQISNSQGISFKTDGTKMYVLSYASPSVYQYSLSTAWDVSTASYDNVSLAFYGAGVQYQGLTFSPDGTKMIGCTNNGDSIRFMNLNTAWDLSAATNGSSMAVDAQDLTPKGIEVLADGTKLFMVGSQYNRVYVYTLSTAWNFGTSSFTGYYQLPSGTSSGIRFNNDGSSMYITNSNSGITTQYKLTSPYDPLTASAVATLSQPSNTQGLAFSTDGDKLYYITHDNVVHQYSSVSPGFVLTFPSSVTFPIVLEPTATQRTFYEFFTMDGGTTVNLISQEIV